MSRLEACSTNSTGSCGAGILSVPQTRFGPTAVSTESDNTQRPRCQLNHCDVLRVLGDLCGKTAMCSSCFKNSDLEDGPDQS